MTKTAKKTDRQRIYDALPADPILMTDAEIARVGKMVDLGYDKDGQFSVQGKVGYAVAKLREIQANPDASHLGDSNRWYWAVYCDTPEKRRNWVAAIVTCSQVG